MRFLFPYMARWHAANWSRYHQLLTALCRRGHEVFVVQPPALDLAETNYTEVQIETDNGPAISEVAVPARLWEQRFPLEKLVKKGLYTLSCRKPIREIIREQHIDVLLVYNLPQSVLVHDVPCLRVFDIADDLPSMLAQEVGKPLGPFAHWVARLWQRRMASTCELVTVASTIVKERAAPSAALIPNGICLQEIANVDGADIRRQYPKPVVGYLGAFEYFVDMDMVLNVARRLPEFTFLLVGGGRGLEHVRSRVQQERLDNVVLRGPVPHAEGLSHITAMDVCLVPFKRGPVADGACPLKLFEYAALGKPIVSTHITEVERIAGDYVLFADTVDDTSTVIRQLVQSPSTYQGLQRLGQERVQRAYSWDSIAEQFLSAVEQAIGAQRTRVTLGKRQPRISRDVEHA